MEEEESKKEEEGRWRKKKKEEGRRLKKKKEEEKEERNRRWKRKKIKMWPKQEIPNSFWLIPNFHSEKTAFIRRVFLRLLDSFNWVIEA